MPEEKYIYLNIEDYKRWGKTEKDFWNDMSDIIRVLTDNGYAALVRYEDCGGYVIGYTHTDFDLGDDRYRLLTADEDEELYFSRQEKEENLKNSVNLEKEAV